MSKIGILTWYFGANYGAVAQSYALYHTVKSMGNESFLINYKPSNYIDVIKQVSYPSKNEFYKIWKYYYGKKKIERLSELDFIEITPRVYSADDINQLDLDIIIFGSDAIFNVLHPLFDNIYYGVGINKRKIAYAPSCEYLNSDYILTDEIKQSLREFYCISVRDNNTSELLYNNIGLKPPVMVDPTFLCDFSSFQDFFPYENYILVYSFSLWKEYSGEISAYAKTRHLKIIAIGQYINWADKSLPYASFSKWVMAFKHASVVFTDSFHGVVFSLKNRKQIILLGREDKHTKINSLLCQFNILLKLYKGGCVNKYLEENHIDYGLSSSLIVEEVDNAKLFLKQSIT